MIGSHRQKTDESKYDDMASMINRKNHPDGNRHPEASDETENMGGNIRRREPPVQQKPQQPRNQQQHPQQQHPQQQHPQQQQQFPQQQPQQKQSRQQSRNASRNASRQQSRNASRQQSRNVSPNRSNLTNMAHHAVDSAGDAVESAAKHTGQAVSSGLGTVGKVLGSAAKSIASVPSAVAHTVSSGLHGVRDKVLDTALGNNQDHGMSVSHPSRGTSTKQPQRQRRRSSSSAHPLPGSPEEDLGFNNHRRDVDWRRFDRTRAWEDYESLNHSVSADDDIASCLPYYSGHAFNVPGILHPGIARANIGMVDDTSIRYPREFRRDIHDRYNQYQLEQLQRRRAAGRGHFLSDIREDIQDVAHDTADTLRHGANRFGNVVHDTFEDAVDTTENVASKVGGTVTGIFSAIGSALGLTHPEPTTKHYTTDPYYGSYNYSKPIEEEKSSGGWFNFWPFNRNKKKHQEETIVPIYSPHTGTAYYSSNPYYSTQNYGRNYDNVYNDRSNVHYDTFDDGLHSGHRSREVYTLHESISPYDSHPLHVTSHEISVDGKKVHAHGGNTQSASKESSSIHLDHITDAFHGKTGKPLTVSRHVETSAPSYAYSNIHNDARDTYARINDHGQDAIVSRDAARRIETNASNREHGVQVLPLQQEYSPSSGAFTFDTREHGQGQFGIFARTTPVSTTSIQTNLNITGLPNENSREQYVLRSALSPTGKHVTRSVQCNPNETVVITETIERIPTPGFQLDTTALSALDGIQVDVALPPATMHVQPPITLTLPPKTSLALDKLLRDIGPVSMPIAPLPAIDTTILVPEQVQYVLDVEHRPIDTSLDINIPEPSFEVVKQIPTQAMDIEHKLVKESNTEVRSLPTAIVVEHLQCDHGGSDFIRHVVGKTHPSENVRQIGDITISTITRPEFNPNGDVNLVRSSRIIPSDDARNMHDHQSFGETLENIAEDTVEGAKSMLSTAATKTSNLLHKVTGTPQSFENDTDIRMRQDWKNLSVDRIQQALSNAALANNDIRHVTDAGLQLITTIQREVEDLKALSSQTEAAAKLVDEAKQAEIQAKLSDQRLRVEKELLAQIQAEEEQIVSIRDRASQLHSTVGQEISTKFQSRKEDILRQLEEERALIESRFNDHKSRHFSPKAQLDKIWDEKSRLLQEAKQRSEASLSAAMQSSSAELQRRYEEITREASEKEKEIAQRNEEGLRILAQTRSLIERQEREFTDRNKSYLNNTAELRTTIDKQSAQARDWIRQLSSKAEAAISSQYGYVTDICKKREQALADEQAKDRELLEKLNQSLLAQTSFDQKSLQKRIQDATNYKLNELKRAEEMAKNELERRNSLYSTSNQGRLKEVEEQCSRLRQQLDRDSKNELQFIQKLVQEKAEQIKREQDRLRSWEADQKQTINNACGSIEKELSATLAGIRTNIDSQWSQLCNQVEARKRELGLRQEAYFKALDEEARLHSNRLQSVNQSYSQYEDRLRGSISSNKSRVSEIRGEYESDLANRHRLVQERENILANLRRIEEEKKQALSEAESSFAALQAGLSDASARLGRIILTETPQPIVRTNYSVETKGRVIEGPTITTREQVRAVPVHIQSHAIPVHSAMDRFQQTHQEGLKNRVRDWIHGQDQTLRNNTTATSTFYGEHGPVNVTASAYDRDTLTTDSESDHYGRRYFGYTTDSDSDRSSHHSNWSSNSSYCDRNACFTTDSD